MKRFIFRYSPDMLLNVLLYILLIPSVIIFVVHFLLAVGVLLNRVRDSLEQGDTPALKVSVIVAAKDEERTLPALFASLEAQTYAGFEIVLVNDRSTDRTGSVMEDFFRRHGERVTIIHNDRECEGVNPKQLALDLGVEVAEGEIYLFTDADCVLPERWIEDHLKYFRDPKVGVVFGQLSLPDGFRFVDRFQGFDQALIHQYNSGAAGLGMPTGCFGNNMVARAEVIRDIGGFQALGYTLTEDADLIAAAGAKKWKVRVSSKRSTMITTFPQPGWKQFVNHHIRWNSGGYYSSNLSTALGYRFIVLYLVFSVAVIPFSLLLPLLLILPVTSFITIGLLGFLAGLLYRKDKVAYLLRLVPYTLFFMVFYAFVTVLSIIKVTPEWKGKKLKATE